MYATYATLFLGFVALAWYLLTFNRFVNLRNGVDQTWSNIDVELQRRLDLIDNLVNVARGYARHEQTTLRNVINARSRVQQAHTPEQANDTHEKVTSVMRHLVALVEAYPELKADAQFRNLSVQLTDTENRIAERRHAYNQMVNRYLDAKMVFPAMLVDKVHHFPARMYFDAPDKDVDTPPAISLT